MIVEKDGRRSMAGCEMAKRTRARRIEAKPTGEGLNEKSERSPKEREKTRKRRWACAVWVSKKD